MEAFPEGSGSLSTAVGMLWRSHQSSLWKTIEQSQQDWIAVLYYSGHVFSCLLLKGSAIYPRWALHDAKLWAGLCSSYIHLTALCRERSGPHTKESRNDSSRRKELSLTCSHGELRILAFSLNIFIISRKNWSLYSKRFWKIMEQITLQGAQLRMKVGSQGNPKE